VAAVSYNGVSIDIEFPDGRHSTVSNTCLPQTAIDLPLGRRDMERALALARWPHSDAERERFHRQYLVGVNGPTVENWAVEQVEVITEFRRLALIAEEHARVNDMFGRAGVQEAEQALRPWLGRLSNRR